MKSLLFLIVFISSFFESKAQLENSLLWKISGNGLNKSSYLYGTIHKVCKSSLNITPELKSIIASSDTVYEEIIFEESLNDFKSHFDEYLKNGKTLKNYYTPEQYLLLEKKYNKIMKPYNLKLEYFENYKPYEALKYLIPSTYNCEKWTSYEEQISLLAKKANVPVLGIETYDEHNSFMEESESSIKENADFLYLMITDSDSLDKYLLIYKNIFQQYRDKNIEEMYKSGDFTHKDLLLDFRNKLWIPRIAQYSKRGQILYAVGAAHLAGENGVINLLRKEGFILTPLF